MVSMLRSLVLLLLCGICSGAQPPLLVIALDGFRWDFAEREHTANILDLKRDGASVETLVPSFPSTTFPNFHAMATGMEPSHHDLVAMMFYDRERRRSFSYMKNSSEGEWYGGTPFWLLAEAAGIKTATYFWPGTDANIQGKSPTYFRKYDGRVPNEERIAQVLAWFRLPESERPGLVVVYFSDVDSAGHKTGPDSPETRAAIQKVDAAVGELVKGVRKLRKDTNIVVLSDHGQIAVASRLDLSARANFQGCLAANEAPMTMLYCDNPERVRAELLKSSPEVEVWRRAETPEYLQYRDNPRIGDLIIVPKTPSIVFVVPPGDADAKPVPELKGMHGYDPRRYRAMAGILIGNGPAFRKGAVTPPAKTVDVFALVCRLMGLSMPPGVDAEIRRVAPLLK
jgi:alkaline phosphatase D